MRSREAIINELNGKIHDVLYRYGIERRELTVLMPIEEFNRIAISDYITYNCHVFSNDTEIVTVVGVIVKPIRDIDRVYVCL